MKHFGITDGGMYCDVLAAENKIHLVPP
jgi:hypothetical protein